MLAYMFVTHYIQFNNVTYNPVIITLEYAAGVKYLKECPREPNIPIYLLVGGCFGMTKLMFTLCRQIRILKDDYDDDVHDASDLFTMTRMANVGLNIFLCIWFIFGNYWVLGIRMPHFQSPLHEPSNWCHETVFVFAFWQLVVCHSLLGVCVFLTISFICCYACMTYRNSKLKH
jgi:hypothetical protein